MTKRRATITGLELHAVGAELHRDSGAATGRETLHFTVRGCWNGKGFVARLETSRRMYGRGADRHWGDWSTFVDAAREGDDLWETKAATLSDTGRAAVLSAAQAIVEGVLLSHAEDADCKSRAWMRAAYVRAIVHETDGRHGRVDVAAGRRAMERYRGEVSDDQARSIEGYLGMLDRAEATREALLSATW